MRKSLLSCARKKKLRFCNSDHLGIASLGNFSNLANLGNLVLTIFANSNNSLNWGLAIFANFANSIHLVITTLVHLVHLVNLVNLVLAIFDNFTVQKTRKYSIETKILTKLPISKCQRKSSRCARKSYKSPSEHQRLYPT